MAGRLAGRDRGTSDDDARVVSRSTAPECLGQLPRRRLEPFDRVAILSAGAVRGPSQPPIMLDLAWVGRGGGCLAPHRCRTLAVQPGVSAEQGAFFRPGRGQRSGRSPGTRGVTPVCRGAVRLHGHLLCEWHVRQNAAAAGLDALSHGADAAGYHRALLGGTTAAKPDGALSWRDFVLPL